MIVGMQGCEPIAEGKGIRVYRGKITPCSCVQIGFLHAISAVKHAHRFGYWLPRKGAPKGRVLMLSSKPKAKGGSFPVTVVRA